MSKSPAFQTKSRLQPRAARRRPALVTALVTALAIAVCSLTLSLRSFAHPEIEAQLAHVSTEIARQPDNAELYLQRGHLHRAHRDWKSGLADFRQAAKLDPRLHQVERAIGRLHLEADKPKQALPQLERFLKLRPGDPDGLVLRGRALGKLGATQKAAADFDAALPKLRRPTPELFIERAQILLAGGKEFQERALLGIAEGVEKLGDLYTLHRFAAQLEITSAQPEAALRRVRRLLEKTKGQLSWRILEAELLASSQKPKEAQAAYHQALEKIASLPPHRRSTPVIAETEKSIRKALAEMGAE
jgi:predicted Zn-dependent protease